MHAMGVEVRSTSPCRAQRRTRRGMTESKLVHIVDDEESMRRSTAYALKTSGYAVMPWSSGAAFLKDIKQVEPGCVLLDIRMPEIDGLEVQQILAERGTALPVVIMTGHG